MPQPRHPRQVTIYCIYIGGLARDAQGLLSLGASPASLDSPRSAALYSRRFPRSKLDHGRIAQRESTVFTRRGSLVQSQLRPPVSSPWPGRAIYSRGSSRGSPWRLRNFPDHWDIAAAPPPPLNSRMVAPCTSSSPTGTTLAASRTSTPAVPSPAPHAVAH